MIDRLLPALFAVLLISSSVRAQAPAGGAWRPKNVTAAKSADAAAPLSDVRAASSRSSITKVTKVAASLPTDAGQEWREYDISPYTQRVTSGKPEQAIVDWILRETGYEAWHSEPLGLLSAGRRTLHVYHTPKMHAVVQEMVDRFVNPETAEHVFGLRVISLESPNWRSKLQRLLQPVNAETQGVSAWLLAKEDAALLLSELRKRSDFREHSSPHVVVTNGQSTVATATRPRNFVQDVVLGGVWPGFEPRTAQFDEGFSLEFNPLLSVDGRSAEAVVKCHVDQLEKLVPVMLDVPTPVAPRQRTRIDVPQTASCRLHERFRWPTDQVLLVSVGVVASPSPAPAATGLTLGSSAARSEVLVMMESRGKSATPAATPATPAAAARKPAVRSRF